MRKEKDLVELTKYSVNSTKLVIDFNGIIKNIFFTLFY